MHGSMVSCCSGHRRAVACLLPRHGSCSTAAQNRSAGGDRIVQLCR